MIARLTLIAAVALSGLTACAKIGELDQPPPLVGAQAKADYEAKKHQEEAERARAEAAKEPSSVQTPYSNLPLNNAPYGAPTPPGMSSPFGTPPTTSMPEVGTPAAQ